MQLNTTAGCGSAYHSSSTPYGSSQPQLLLPPPPRRSMKNRSNGGGSGSIQQMHPPSPTGPWICFKPWAAQGGWQDDIQGASSRAEPGATAAAPSRCALLPHRASGFASNHGPLMEVGKPTSKALARVLSPLVRAARAGKACSVLPRRRTLPSSRPSSPRRLDPIRIRQASS